METGKLNNFYISDEIKIRNNITRIDTAFLTSASETEFKDLVNNYSFDKKFNPADFTFYISENGHFCIVLGKEVRKP
jgi:hypothetical protein